MAFHVPLTGMKPCCTGAISSKVLPLILLIRSTNGWMCVLYVSFGSKVRPRASGCVAMGSALLFIVRSWLLVYSAGSDVNRVQVVLSGFS